MGTSSSFDDISEGAASVDALLVSYILLVLGRGPMYSVSAMLTVIIKV